MSSSQAAMASAGVATESLASELRSRIGSNAVLDDADSLRLFSQDVSGDFHPVTLVARPGDTDALVEAVRFANEHDLAITPRGGGMSYSSGYVCQHEGVLCLDTGIMNRVLEVNSEDMYVTVEAGCTWHDLHQTLEPLGLRTPFWGTLSGLKATVGGGLSQNSIFWGSGRHGAAADSVISLDVVLANGDVLSTGGNAKSHSSPFFRHYGPDLTGIFTSDTGALGVKATATLRLLPVQPGKAFSSFEFKEHVALLQAMSQVSRKSLAEACFGFDPTLQSQRMKRASLLEDVKTLGKVMQAQDGKLKAVKEGLRIAASGRGFMKDVQFSVHFMVEEATQAAADAANALIRSICLEAGGREIENSIPKISRAVPFPPLNSMVGPEGERWLPVHGLVPHSKARAIYDALESLFEANRSVMQAQEILHGYMFTYIGTHCFVIEPVFYWPDQLNDLHRATVEESVLAKINAQASNPEAYAQVLRIRTEMTELLNKHGALHLQIGRSYPFQAGLREVPKKTIKALKSMLDPEGRMNPGVLGIP